MEREEVVVVEEEGHQQQLLHGLVVGWVPEGGHGALGKIVGWVSILHCDDGWIPLVENSCMC